MIERYQIKQLDNEEVLYLYLNYSYEFGNFFKVDNFTEIIEEMKELNNNNKITELVKTLIEKMIDMAKDYLELENIVVYSRSLTDPNANYVSGSSFVQYLVKQYGEEAVINSIYGYCSSLPETYAESVKAWKEYINTNYTSYSKYK